MTFSRFSPAVLLSLFLLTSCFHKSDKTGEADDLSQFLLFETPKGGYLTTHEEIFHATSKSYNQGISHISGYTDYRYTIRDVRTGQQVTRIVTGDRENDVTLLGFDGRNLWCYNAAKDGGIEARDPVTMQVVISRQKIEEANPSLAKMLSTPKVYEANQYYQFEYLSGKVIMSDQHGVFYSMDPFSLKATVIDAKPKDFPGSNSVKSTSAYLAPEQNIYMEGDLRKHVRLNDSIKSSDSFLNGEILIEQNGQLLAKRAHELLNNSYSHIQFLRERLDSMRIQFPFLSDETQMYRNYSNRGIVNDYNDWKRELEEMVRDSANGNDYIFRYLNECPIGSDSGIMYILHADNLTDTSSLLISKLKLEKGNLKTQWTTHVPGIYFNPDRGIIKNPMKEVFKAGSPEFRFEEYGVNGNVLCGVKMLFAFGIDTRNGKLLWKEQL